MNKSLGISRHGAVDFPDGADTRRAQQASPDDWIVIASAVPISRRSPAVVGASARGSWRVAVPPRGKAMPTFFPLQANPTE
jgi:hypothetical protein